MYILSIYLPDLLESLINFLVESTANNIYHLQLLHSVNNEHCQLQVDLYVKASTVLYYLLQFILNHIRYQINICPLFPEG